jgi:putative oxidoreductase
MMAVSEEAPAALVEPTVPARGSVGASFMILIHSLASVLLRFALAVPFFRSGLTKWEGFLTLAPSTTALFENQIQLRVFDQSLAMPYPVVMAWAVSIIEVVAPVLLVFGLFTRLAALALLLLTVAIFLGYPVTFAQQPLPWVAIAAALVAYGPGEVSIDHFIWRGLRR